jgi:hypothetical protein
VSPSDRPQFHRQQVSSLCSLGLRPHLMTGILRHLIGEHFAQRENIEEPALQDVLWRARDVGNILIESITRWKPNQLADRPAIIIKRNGWQAERIFPDDQYGTTPQGEPIFCNIMQGSHTLFCISKAGEEAEILAAEVMQELSGFAHLIRQTLSLLRFVPVGLGQIFEIEEATENYAVPVDVTYANQNAWTIHEHAPKLKSIEISITALAP